MDKLNQVLARNLKSIRDLKRLSLDKSAELTGVSKTMLGQIERGESNPTINTLWKIANGLKVSFTSLIYEPPADAVVVTQNDIQAVIDDNGRYRVYPFFPYEEGRRFEIYSIEVEIGGYQSSDPHEEGTEEFVTVFEGQLTVRVNGEEYTVHQGDSIRFKADRQHVYHNSGSTAARASMVIYYSN